MIGHDQLQDSIAEELEALVGRLTIMLCTPRAMCQCMREEVGVVELIPEPVLEGRRKRSRAQRSAQLGDDVFNGVAHCAEVFEIFIFNTETDRAL